MSIPFVDLKAQYLNLKNELDLAMANVIEKTAFIGGKNNPFVTTLERNFASFLGIDHVVGCANGTDAIEMALKAMGIGPGDEVIVPAISWISTSESVSSVGAVPVFAELDERYYTMDPKAVESKITAKTKAIIPVHLYGCAADMGSLMDIAERHQLLVLEDCAQAHGATFNGKMVGTFGNASTFSFYPGKNLGAYGDAGAVATNDADLAQRVSMMGNHGQLKKHDHHFEGRNSRLDGMQAAVIDVKLKYLKAGNQQRAANAAIYASKLADAPVVVPTTRENSDHVFHLFVIQTEKRDELKQHLTEHGVGTAIHYPTPLPFMPAYAHLGHTTKDFPIANRVSQSILSLPMYPELPADSIEVVSDLVLNFFRT